jgi:glutaredoxin-like protein NrdH
MPNITVYTKPACVQCSATKKAFDKARHQIPACGHHRRPRRPRISPGAGLSVLLMPLVVTATTHSSGFRPDHITAAA